MKTLLALAILMTACFYAKAGTNTAYYAADQSWRIATNNIQQLSVKIAEEKIKHDAVVKKRDAKNRAGQNGKAEFDAEIASNKKSEELQKQKSEQELKKLLAEERIDKVLNQSRRAK